MATHTKICYQPFRCPRGHHNPEVNDLLRHMRYTHRMRQLSDKGKGFSLIELSIVVTILSIISVLGLEVATTFINARAYDSTKEKLQALDKAVQNFYWVYGRLPCPADITRNTIDSRHGQEQCGIGIYGSVPYNTLHLPLSASIDSYGSKIVYFVGELTTFTDFNGSDAGIEVRSLKLAQPCDATAPPTTSCSILADPSLGEGAAYALISFGADKRGAFNREGIPSTTRCAIRNDRRIDAQNCNAVSGLNETLHDGTAPITIPINVIYDSRFNNGSVPENYFDDIVVWRPKGKL